eukprot:c20504_g1_i1.p1 GENE.c20504_g1_i1~~c20504_g1_i1.p1  ORF type:complete len:577 (+),score=141.32 c20504_g1_i1:42-1772(+)
MFKPWMFFLLGLAATIVVQFQALPDRPNPADKIDQIDVFSSNVRVLPEHASTILSVVCLVFAFMIAPMCVQFFSGARETVETCVVTGTGCGLPGYDTHEDAFSRTSLQLLFKGHGSIQQISAEVTQMMLEKNVVEVVKTPTGQQDLSVNNDTAVKVAAPMCTVDLTRYGMSPKIAAVIDEGSQAAVAAGLEALRDAGLVPGNYGDASSWQLPEALRASTGVIFAASFPALASVVSELDAYHTPMGDAEMSKDSASMEAGEYSFDRKFLFRVLVLANAQLAEFCKASGPNTHINAACAGTTQALSIAQDWIRLRRCERVVVVAGDSAASSTLMPWVGNGFRAMGATCLSPTPEEAAQPFSAQRSGMIVGSGAVGFVLESHDSYRQRRSPASMSMLQTMATMVAPKSGQTDAGKERARCVLIDTFMGNSAHHGTGLCEDHIAKSLDDFLTLVESRHGVSRNKIAAEGLYMSHETSTQLCAKAEVAALHKCLGTEGAERILVGNTKGLTGHAMGVSFEDLVAVEVLRRGCVPPVANFTRVDPKLGRLNIAVGGECDKRFVLRFAAGFGSQVSFALYGLA